MRRLQVKIGRAQFSLLLRLLKQLQVEGLWVFEYSPYLDPKGLTFAMKEYPYRHEREERNRY